jgi:hypothetical protein
MSLGLYTCERVYVGGMLYTRELDYIQSCGHIQDLVYVRVRLYTSWFILMGGWIYAVEYMMEAGFYCLPAARFGKDSHWCMV